MAVKVFLTHIIVPVILFVLISNYVIGSNFLLEVVNNYLPPYGTTSVRAHVEKQLLHVEAETMLARKQDTPTIIFVGSSSVVNGIDVDLFKKEFKQGDAFAVKNFGMTGLMAYELPLLKEYFLAQNVNTVVYLYNTFSFSSVTHPNAIETRWNTLEVLRELGYYKDITIDKFLEGSFGEAFFVVRFRHVLQKNFWNTINNSHVKFDYPYDYSPDSKPMAPVPRVLLQPMPESNFLRAGYLGSDTDANNLGYQSFSDFLAEAKKRNIRVIVAPAPEPEFSLWGEYRQGINVARIDNHVRRICESYGVPFIERFSDIEKRDEYFMDIVHLHKTGRELLSMRLAKFLNEM